METNIIQIENSKGVIIPSAFLREMNLSLKSAVVIENDKEAGGIVLKPSPRQGWEDAAKQMATSKEEQLLISDVFEDENLDWWQWDEN